MSINRAAAGPPDVSVIMPVYDGEAFVRRAIASLQAQSLEAWELLAIDDGSRDGTPAMLAAAAARDPRIRLVRLPENCGLGAALNAGLAMATAPLVAYLPADDVYYRDHLASLAACLRERQDAVLAYSGVRHHYNREAPGRVPGEPLQLVQAMHRRTARRWTERTDLVSDDLGRLFWDRLRAEGEFAGTAAVTCEWVEHPGQLHRLLREPVGGINPFRQRFEIAHPLRFHSTAGHRIDEVEHYRCFRERPDTPPAADGLRILLVGELAYNPERVLALEEREHRLYGLWTREPYWYNTVGPLPFGHVQDVPHEGWERAVRALRPDIIYALLNWQAVPFAHEVLCRTPGIPFAWHFKEGPLICLEKGTWPQLIDLYLRSDGNVYCTPEMRDWFQAAVPGIDGSRPSLVLDGDLPKREWFTDDVSPRLSERDGEVHTVVPGRPIGLHPGTVAELAGEGVHLHFYGDFTHGQWREWIATAQRTAPNHLHLHPHVDQEDWVREFSQYDAGWLHAFESTNAGEVRRANWDDLDYPARIATLLAAGLPLIQYDNAGSVSATQALAREGCFGVFYRTVPELAARLRDSAAMERLRERAWAARSEFTFDAHADRLIGFFRDVIAASGARTGASPGRVAGAIRASAGVWQGRPQAPSGV